MSSKEWTFLEAYDYIKANSEGFQLCNHPDELSGKHPCICVYGIEGFVGKLRWRIQRGEDVVHKMPQVDQELQNALNLHMESKKNTTLHRD
jgi:hypothetical protein